MNEARTIQLGCWGQLPRENEGLVRTPPVKASLGWTVLRANEGSGTIKPPILASPAIKISQPVTHTQGTPRGSGLIPMHYLLIHHPP